MHFSPAHWVFVVFLSRSAVAAEMQVAGALFRQELRYPLLFFLVAPVFEALILQMTLVSSSSGTQRGQPDEVCASSE